VSAEEFSAYIRQDAMRSAKLVTDLGIEKK
jgi:hypothetical protein